jgi:LemA protein
MKTKHLFWAVPLAIIVILIFSLFSFNNSAVRKLETVKTSLSNVESSYQRRADVITGLVNTVKGAADFEKEVLTDVVEARAKAGQTNINLNDLNANSINQFA